MVDPGVFVEGWAGVLTPRQKSVVKVAFDPEAWRRLHTDLVNPDSHIHPKLNALKTAITRGRVNPGTNEFDLETWAALYYEFYEGAHQVAQTAAGYGTSHPDMWKWLRTQVDWFRESSPGHGLMGSIPGGCQARECYVIAGTPFGLYCFDAAATPRRLGGYPAIRSR